MGYTTEFTGEFHCYHPENQEVGAFLQAVREEDAAAVPALADWLLDHDDARGAAIARLVKEEFMDLKTLWILFGIKPEHAAYLRAFNRSRRVRRDPQRAKALPDSHREAAGLPIGPEGGYYVGGAGRYYPAADDDESVLDYNHPPEGQPGLWCRWTPSDDRTAIVWDRGEKFYNYVAWLDYLLKHFLTPWGYVVNGKMTWQGEDERDQGRILVTNNVVRSR